MVPFRLTRNLITLFTPFGVEGVFIASMAAAAQAMSAEQRELSVYLSLFFRDDLLQWMRRMNRGSSASQQVPGISTAASGGGGSSVSSLPTAALKAMVNVNVERALMRLSDVAPSDPAKWSQPDPSGATPQSSQCQAGVHKLVLEATSPRNLSRLDPTWHPWF